MTLSLFALALAAPAPAATALQMIGDGERVSVEASVQDFGNAGKRRVVESTIRFDRGPLTFVLAPAVGTRNADGVSRRGSRIGGDLYARLTPALSSRTYARVATSSPVFARWELGQDVTWGIADRTNLTGGVRFARYYGGDKVSFLTTSLRRYFRGGSIAYTLTAAHLSGADTSFGHTVNVALNGSRGSVTQLWLSSASRAQELELVRSGQHGRVNSAVVRRVQPLTRHLAVTGRLGLTRYETSTRHTSPIAGLGLEVRF